MKRVEGQRPEIDEVLAEENYILGTELAVQIMPLLEQAQVRESMESGGYFLDIRGVTPTGPTIAYASLERVEKKKKRGPFWHRWVERKPFIALMLGTDEGTLLVNRVSNGDWHRNDRHVAQFRVLFSQVGDQLNFEVVEAYRYDEKSANGRKWIKVGPARANLVLGASIDAMEKLTED